jgi:hypothetical protein
MKKTHSLLAALSAIMLSSCSSYKPLFLIHIVDSSESAKEENFVKVSQKICHSVISASKEKDLYSYITIDAELSPAADPVTITSKDSMHANCKNLPVSNSTESGTFPCKAWARAEEMISARVDTRKYVPVIISHIQANEMEDAGNKECTDAMMLADKVEAAQGKILIVGSTNSGGKYNTWLWNKFSKKLGVQFVSGNTARSIESEIKTIREGDQ